MSALEALVAEPDPPPAVRIPPAPLLRLGPLAALVAAGAGRRTGHGPLHVFRVLGRHPRLFRPWAIYSGQLLQRGVLPRRETELVVLRVAARCGSAYEWRQHVPLGLEAGLTEAEVRALAALTGAAPSWPPRDAALLQATDELLDHRALSDATHAALRRDLDTKALIELCVLVGQYQGLATALGGLGVPLEVRA